jgi:glycine/D-amino acid oxidase-like deaminating enzyme
MQITIVGAGIMGLSTAWALTRDGHDVTVYEQGPIPQPLGSSVDQHRLIRLPYGAHTGYMKMALEAYALWESLWDDLGERLYAPTGTLVLDSEADGGWAADSAAALGTIGTPVEWLPPDEVERRFPLVHAGGIVRGFCLESGGVLYAERIVAALARRLEAAGAVLEPGTRISAVDPERGRVTLADGGVRDADALVIAAGAWLPQLLPELAQRVTPSRQVVVYLQPPAALAADWARAPMILDIAPNGGFYLVPPRGGAGLKVGDHRFSLNGDPDAPREAERAQARAVLALCRGRLRDFGSYELDHARVCFYTVAPEERFIVEARGLCILVSACSGHGFKFGPLVGRRIADTLAGRVDAAMLTRWAAGEA